MAPPSQLSESSTNSSMSDLSQPLLPQVQESVRRDDAETLPSPILQANFLSRLSFQWIQPLLKLGNSRLLELKDVPAIPVQDQAEQNVNMFWDAWGAQKRKLGSRSSVLRTLWACYWKDVLWTGLLAFLKGAGTVAGPIFLYFFVDYASGNKLFKHEGVVLVCCLLTVKMVENFSQRHWYFGVRRLGLKVQSSVITAVYNKELCLSSQGKRRHATGEIVNYISVDAYRLSELVWWMHWTWMVPFEIAVALGILFAIVGLATIPGLVLIIIFILLITPLIMRMQSCQGEFMIAQDERLRATSEILIGMKVIKLQAWEEKFQTFLERMRGTEFKWLTGTQKNRNYATILYWLMPTIVTAVVLITCILLKMELTSTIVFTVLATFRIIQDPIRTVPDVLSAIIQAHVAFGRLDQFLHEDELPTDAVVRDLCASHLEYAIRVDGAVLSWSPDETYNSRPTLRDINLVVRRGEKVAVCGSIGSGKSTLLYSILGEIPKLRGTIQVAGTIAYVAQTAWIQTGTVRENILFGLPFDEDRYRSTLRACALEQDIQNFSHGDLTEIGERGINMSGGQKQRIQLARAVYNDADIYLLDDPFSAVDAQTAATLFHDCVMGVLRNKTVLLVTHQVEFLPSVDSTLVMQDGEIQQAGTYDDLLASGDAFHRLVTAHQEALHSVTSNGHSHNEEVEDGVVDIKVMKKRISRGEILEKANKVDAASQLVQEEEKESGDLGLKPYADYVVVAGGRLAVAGIVVGQIAFSVAQLYSNVWLATEVSDPAISSSLLIGVYVIVSLISVVFFFARSALMVDLGLKASSAFFHGFTNSLMKAPMSFFDSAPSGRILNRASVDMSVLDLDIPFCFGFVLALVFDLLCIVLVTAIATWQIILVVIPALAVVQYLQRYYATAARELSRINSTTKAPIVNNSAETISGTATIRAFDMVERFRKKNLMLIDHDASVYFHKHAALEWLIFRIELCSIVVTVSALLVTLKTELSAGFAGLAITYALALNNCQIFLSWWQCMFAIFIVSVERIKQYMQLPAEAPAIIESSRPPVHWPSRGKVLLDNLEIRYRPNAPLVLKGISCTFQGGQKVGVVGRTGSGKTTLISALFRLVEPASGKIHIDDVDICTIGLHDLRYKLGIIPQEPVLFRGTVRSNLDPLNQYSDMEIWETLEKCQLGKVIQRLPLQLESPVVDQGENWSAGQRQLFCLGRVLLKRSQVLVLDEATASIDSATDALLQRLIRIEFSACTVITVAHRIPTVVDSDMVLALRDGYLIEFAPPKKLMENKASLFSQLVAEYWAQAARNTGTSSAS